METEMKVTPAEGTDTRRAAMIFYASGRTAAGLRSQAADPVTVAMVAAGSPEDEVRAMMLALADGVDQIVAEGLTAPDCWRILGWTPDFVAEVLGAQDGAR